MSNIKAVPVYKITTGEFLGYRPMAFDNNNRIHNFAMPPYIECKQPVYETEEKAIEAYEPYPGPIRGEEYKCPGCRLCKD